MRCCAKCKTPGYGCANGACRCHFRGQFSSVDCRDGGHADCSLCGCICHDQPSTCAACAGRSIAEDFLRYGATYLCNDHAAERTPIKEKN